MDASERNAEIRRLYIGGLSLRDCSEKFSVSHETIRKILRKAGVFRNDRLVTPEDRTSGPDGRSAFIGVNVTDSAKDALKQKALERGISVSRMISDQIDAMVKPS